MKLHLTMNGHTIYEWEGGIFTQQDFDGLVERARVSLVEGDTKTWADCNERFNNTLNFRVGGITYSKEDRNPLYDARCGYHGDGK